MPRKFRHCDLKNVLKAVRIDGPATKCVILRRPIMEDVYCVGLARKIT